MPLFEYECNSCKHRFEVLRGYSKEETCPLCSSDARKVLSPATVIYTGTGFYSTDYKGE